MFKVLAKNGRMSQDMAFREHVVSKTQEQPNEPQNACRGLMTTQLSIQRGECHRVIK
jgi:hypothetical protein